MVAKTFRYSLSVYLVGTNTTFRTRLNVLITAIRVVEAFGTETKVLLIAT